MLAEVISFGGLWKERRTKPVRLATEQKSVLVQIKTKQRDTREKVDGKPNPRFGKMYYQSADSIELFDTNPAEVKEHVLRGINAALKR